MCEGRWLAFPIYQPTDIFVASSSNLVNLDAMISREDFAMIQTDSTHSPILQPVCKKLTNARLINVYLHTFHVCR